MSDLDPAFSLTAALHEILRRAGLTLAIDDVHAALGLPLLIAAAPDHPPLHWPSLARDSFLIPAARLFGLDIRDLHPPEAARGLERAVGFRQHFDASYQPLIARALEHGQPVIAWQGWADDAALSWGIVEAQTALGVGFAGTPFPSSSWSANRVTLSGPPVQVYVVEAIAPRRPDDHALLRAVLRHGRAAFDGTLSERYGLSTGPAALALWRLHAGNSVIHALRASLANGAESMARCLKSRFLVPGTPGATRALGEWCDACATLAAACRHDDPSAPWSANLCNALEEAGRLVHRAAAEVYPEGEST